MTHQAWENQSRGDWQGPLSLYYWLEPTTWNGAIIWIGPKKQNRSTQQAKPTWRMDLGLI
jgi:hypothetical protein